MIVVYYECIEQINRLTWILDVVNFYVTNGNQSKN